MLSVSKMDIALLIELAWSANALKIILGNYFFVGIITYYNKVEGGLHLVIEIIVVLLKSYYKYFYIQYTEYL